ncbi:MAG TPA: vitamin K epoxide reductase family protein [Chitinophagaceae bacterium]|jgi:uncharacterized membrane protein|nr:vitamin K epoxide reductase family protein [Chitinophagaceae bacterium]
MIRLLNNNDREKALFIVDLAKLVLKKLQVSFSEKYLEKEIAFAYASTFDVSANPSENQDEVLVADREDPSNIAFVMIEALKKYHIKTEIVEAPVHSPDQCSLVILRRTDDSMSYKNLLGIAENRNNSMIAPENGKMTTRLHAEDAVEQFVKLERTNFTAEPGLKQRKKAALFMRVGMGIIGFVFFVAVVTALINAVRFYPILTWLPALLVIIAGLVVSYHLLVLEKTNSYSNAFLRKICTGVQKGFSCQQVLHSKASKLFGLIGMADIGAVYFVSIFSTITYSLLSYQLADFYSLLFWFSVLPLPYTLFSLYYQVSVIKKICILCITVQVLLWLQFSAFSFLSPLPVGYVISFYSLLIFGLIVATVVVIYYIAIRYWALRRSHKQTVLHEHLVSHNKEYVRWIIDKQSSFQAPQLPGTITLGEDLAGVSLTVIVSPSCGACKTAVETIGKLRDWFDDKLQIKLIVAATENSADFSRNILAVSLSNQFEEAVETLEQWYNNTKNSRSNGKGVIAALNGQTNMLAVDEAYKIHLAWYKQAPIPHTPFMILNDKILPSQYYSLDELKEIIEHTIEINQAVENE